MKPRILMLGWDNDPELYSGLGKAVQGLVNEMSNYVDILFVAPQKKDKLLPPLSAMQPVASPYSPVSMERPYFKRLELPYVEGHFDPYGSLASAQPIFLQQPLSTTYEVQPTPEEEPAQILNRKWEAIGINSPASIFEDWKLETLLQDSFFQSVLEYTRSLLFQVRDQEFDLIHAHDWMTFFAALELKALYNKPLILHLHSLEYDRMGAGAHTWVYDLEKYAIAHADQVVAVSYYQKSILQNEYQLNVEHVTVVHNGITPKKIFRKPSRWLGPQIAFIGRITRQKGVEQLVAMAAQVLQALPQAKFVVAGDGDLLPAIVDHAAYLNLGTSVFFTGQLDEAGVDELLASSDLLIMPSISEPFGLVALEAAQFGVPCILSENSGVSEVLIQSPTLSPTDTAKWVQYVVRLIQMPTYRESIVAAGFDALYSAHWRHRVQLLLEVYGKALS